MTSPPPASDHFDGQRFFNPGPTRASGRLADVLRWRLQGGRMAWLPPGRDPVSPPPPAQVSPGQVSITFVGHASFMLRIQGQTVLTDPVWSERCSPVGWAGPKRARPPGLALEAVGKPDLILISHNHYDHLDLATLRTLQQRAAPRVVTLLGNNRVLRHAGIEAVELDWWQQTKAGPLTITATPARHFSARTPFDRDRSLWGGFMIAANGGQMLFAGDSGAGPHWAHIRARLGPPNVALLPIGAYEPRWFMAPVHMNPEEAVQAHLALGATRSVGMHFGTFQLTDEPIDAPVQALATALQAAHVPDEAFVTHGFGETRLYRLQDGLIGEA